MSLTEQAAKQIRDFLFGGNYTGSNLRQHLTGVTWQNATTKIHSLNTIAALVFHIDYYLAAVVQVMEGGPLDAHDLLSYDHPPIASVQDWDRLVVKVFADGEQLATLVERSPENLLQGNFLDGKYGTYYRNIHGVIEHAHYHLGQIVLIKKILPELTK